MDIINVVLAYLNEHYAKEPTQNLVAAFKLKIEFLVLNQLVEVTTQTRLAYMQAAAAGGRYTKEGSSVGSSSLPSNARKQSSTMPKGSSISKDMTAFFEDRTSPLTSTDSTIYGQVVEPPAAYPPKKRSTTSISTSAQSRPPRHHHHQSSRLNLHTSPSNPSSTSIEALKLQYDPETGNMIRRRPSSRRRPQSFWHRMWVALPTGEDGDDGIEERY